MPGDRRWPKLAARVLPGSLKLRLGATVLGRHYRPPVGAVRFGDLRRTSPSSRQFRFDGPSVDRYYTEEC
ncbi:hypothetical protein [Geodermatophilus sp. SYSU D01176]